MTPAPDLRELLAKATPGPWEYESDREGSSMGWIGHQIPAGRSTVFSSMFEVEGDSAQQEINAELAVAAVNALPSLLDTIARLEARERKLVEALRPFVREANRLNPLPQDGVVQVSNNVEIWQVGSENFTRSRITYGDLHRARTLTPETDHDE